MVYKHLSLVDAAAIGASFRFAQLVEVDFTRALLMNVSFQRAVVTGANFGHCNLKGANFADAIGVAHADFSDALL